MGLFCLFSITLYMKLHLKSSLVGPAARYLQKIELQQEVDKTARTVQKQERQIEALESQVGVISPSRLAKSKVYLKRHWKSIIIILLCITVSILATLVSVSTVRSRYASSSGQSPQKSSQKLEMLLGQEQDGKPFLNFGVRLDSRLQECQEAHWKRSFPDLDYAFFGYDVLKGYPLASGHDPGFTHPIFLSKYSSGKQTSDCRYSVPEGLIVVPDVSCVTSFSSKVIRNKVEMSSSLSAAVNVEGSGWGFKFSASASYKESVAQMSSGEFLYIVSQAQCRYYFSNMTTSRRFKCVPQILGSLSIHIFTLLFLLITYSYRCSADNTACFRRAQAL